MRVEVWTERRLMGRFKDRPTSEHRADAWRFVAALGRAVNEGVEFEVLKYIDPYGRQSSTKYT